MSILASIAVSNEVDVLGTALQASESCIAVELENGSIHTFNAQGQPLRTFTADDDDEVFTQRFKAFSIIGDRLIVGKGRSGTGIEVTGGCLEVIDVITSKTLTSIEVSERPKKIISYHDGGFDYIIASPHGAHVELVVLPSASSSLLSSECSITRAVATTADIPSFRIFRHHMAKSTLALLGAREGIVQLRQLSGLTRTDTRLITDLCTIYSVEETLPPLLPSPEDSEKISVSDGNGRVRKIYSVLVHSSGHILTGDDDGKIKVWDYSPMLSGDMTIPEHQGHNGKTLTKPAHTVQNSRPGHLVNGLLECSHQVGPNDRSYGVVSTDTEGFVRLWNFVDHDTSNNNFQLNLIGQHKLFDHSFTCRAVTNKGWLVAGGKEGINENNDACGLNGQLKMLNLTSLVNDGHYPSAEVRNLGGPSLAVWSLQIVNSSEEGFQHIVVSLMRRGRAWLEVWKI